MSPPGPLPSRATVTLSLCAHALQLLSQIATPFLVYPLQRSEAPVPYEGDRIPVYTCVANLQREALYAVPLSYALFSYHARGSRDSIGAVRSLDVLQPRLLGLKVRLVTLLGRTFDISVPRGVFAFPRSTPPSSLSLVITWTVLRAGSPYCLVLTSCVPGVRKSNTA